MQTLSAISLTASVNNWLAHTCHPRVLHVFDNVCNLINEHTEVLSIVTPQIGMGPFNLVVENDICFTEHLSIQSPISNSPDSLVLANLTIHTANASLWSPRPDWEALHANKKNIAQLLITHYELPILQSPNSLLSESLVYSLCSADLPSALIAAQKLAGLGIGLTPSGDDFIMGALYAAWIIHPREVAEKLAEEIAGVAIPLTTSLAGAWINAASKGEAGELWHDFFNSLLLESPKLESSISNILAVGETSGADALAGFLGVFMAKNSPLTK